MGWAAGGGGERAILAGIQRHAPVVEHEGAIPWHREPSLPGKLGEAADLASAGFAEGTPEHGSKA